MHLQSSTLLVALISIGLENVLSNPYPEYHDHLGAGPNFVDYYSKPKYAFGYEVDGLDEYFRELSHGRWEIRDGDVVQGQYRVLLPDGRIQIVSYVADKGGYRPTIKYINKGVLPPPPPTYAHVKVPHFVPEPEPLPPPIHFEPEPFGHNPYAMYGSAFGYGFDPFVALGSSNANTKYVSEPNPSNYRKRALLYDRTLFRKDVEGRKKRRSPGQKRRRSQNRDAVFVSAVPPTQISVTAAPPSISNLRRVSPAAAYNTK